MDQMCVEDLVRGYRNFLTSSIKVYFFGSAILKKEINYFTNGELRDSLLFFICAFDKVDSKFLKFSEVDPSFSEYVEIQDGQVELTVKGQDLKEYLEMRLIAQAKMLEFNGVKPEYIGKVTTMLRRFEKFWKLINTFKIK